MSRAMEWRHDNAQWLGLCVQRLRLLLNRHMLWLTAASPAGQRMADWLVACPDFEAEQAFYRDDKGAQAIDTAVAQIDTKLQTLAETMRAASAAPALASLAELAGLSPFERDLLVLTAAPAIDGAFERAYCELHDDPRAGRATLHLALGLFCASAAQRVLCADALMPTRPLRTLGLIACDDEQGPLLTRPLAIDDRIADFLRGVNRVDTRVAPLLTQAPAPLVGGAVDETIASLATKIAGTPHWPTINLIGSVAGGACELAAKACAAARIDLYTLDVVALAARTADERALLLPLLGREALLGGFALLIDTARLEPAHAGAVNDVVARLAAPLFVVSAERWAGSVAAHLIRVSKPSRAEQLLLWRAALSGRANTVNGEIESIVQQFDFGPPAIAQSVARAADLSDVIDGNGLWRSCREQSGTALGDYARRLTPCYGWDDIVVPDDIGAQLREIAAQVGARRRVYEAWGFGARLARGRGISALFAGPSGTGKTMAAEILANHLDLDLYRIDLSRVVSKYIGETEKNLRAVFDAAESSGAILFFDEADALFGTRTEVRDSHDRYANIEVNYLLQRMEDYAGLAILATNRRAALDNAFLRRLRFVIEFPFPGNNERRRIWERAFPAQAETDGIEIGFLSGLELSGANIQSVAINAAFLAASEQKPIAMTHVVRAAAREYVKLSKPISAAEFGAYHATVRT